MKKIIFIAVIGIACFLKFAESQWLVQTSPINIDLKSLSVINENNAFATSYYYVLRTTNGGTDWTINLNLNTYFDDIQFVNSSTGYIIGRTTTGSAIYKTTNTGQNWLQVSSIPVALKFSMYFLNSSTGFVVTYGGVYRTSDGGINWENRNNAPTHFTDVFFCNDTIGWCTTETGVIYRTTNGGYSYWGIGAPLGYSQNGLNFLNCNTGWLAVDNSYITKSTNAIEVNSWVTYQLSMPSCQLNAVYFASDMTGWVAGCQGSIHRSTDGGLTWNIQTIGTTTSLYDIKFVNQLTGWAVGANGRILKTTNGGLVPVMPISSEVPENFSLSQNYPNPFNPSTRIKFSIPKSGNAKLTIYNDQGKEMTKLLNEELTPGIYEIEFNAVNFPSGVYFYNLVVGNPKGANNTNNGGFSETKKMVLVK